MIVMAVILTLAVIAASVFAERYLARRKSFLPGLIVPCLCLILLVFGLLYGYPFEPQYTGAFPPANYMEHARFLDIQNMQTVLPVINVTALFALLNVYFTERKKQASVHQQPKG